MRRKEHQFTLSDAALRFWLDPSLSPSSSSSSSSSSSTSLYDPGLEIAYHSFERAYQAKNRFDQAKHLEKVSDLFVLKQDYERAAHFLNAALVCINYIDERLRLLAKLEDIEKRATGASLKPGFLSERRSTLRGIREKASGLLKEHQPPEDVQLFLTNEYCKFFATLVNETISMISPLPFESKFAVIGFGSMGRREMCPYSDIEFAFLVDSSSDPVILRTRQIFKFLKIKMINIGETHYKLIRQPEEKSLTPHGFSIDCGGLSPAGKEGIYELIGTPEELAEFQREEWFRHHDCEIALVNAMASACYITGNQELFVEYQDRVNDILYPSFSFLEKDKLWKCRARELLQGHYEEFKPRLNEDVVLIREFGTKKELCRLFQFVSNALALYHRINESNTLRQLDQLKTGGFIKPDVAEMLKATFRLAIQLRLQAEFANSSGDELLNQDQITSEVRDNIFAIYDGLNFLHERLGCFLKGDEKAFEGTLPPSFEEGRSRTLAEREVDIDRLLSSCLTEMAAYCDEALSLTALMRRLGHHSTIIAPKEAKLKIISAMLKEFND